MIAFVLVVCATPAEAQITNGLPWASGRYPVKHVIIMVQENRSLDNFFNGYSGAFTTQTAVGQNNNYIQMRVMTKIGVAFDVGHHHSDFVSACAAAPITNGNCTNTGFVNETCTPFVSCPSNPAPPFGYVQQSSVQPYWDMATLDGRLSDMTFQDNEGPSLVNHMYLLASSSRISNATNSAALNNITNGGNAGCNWASPGTTDYVDMTSPFPGTVTGGQTPCTGVTPITSLLDNAGVSWRFIMVAANPTSDEMLWAAPNLNSNICGTTSGNVCTGPEWTSHVVIADPETEIENEINGGTLQGVTWVIPTLANSDHPGGDSGEGGPDYVARVVNTLGGSPYWSNTVLFVYWDDWGGWYDHVSPPPAIPTGNTNASDPNEYGFRVPLITVSTFAAGPSVDHNFHCQSSVNHFIETVFGLFGPINPYSLDQNCDDLTGSAFNFFRAPRAFVTVPLN